MINDFLDKSIATVLIPENDNIEQFSKITYLEVKKKINIFRFVENVSIQDKYKCRSILIFCKTLT